MSPLRVSLLAFTPNALPPAILVLAVGAKYEVIRLGILNTAGRSLSSSDSVSVESLVLSRDPSELSLSLSATDSSNSFRHSEKRNSS